MRGLTSRPSGSASLVTPNSRFTSAFCGRPIVEAVRVDARAVDDLEIMRRTVRVAERQSADELTARCRDRVMLPGKRRRPRGLQLAERVEREGAERCCPA